MNWTPSCRQVALLLSRNLEEPLGLLDRIRMHLHLRICSSCRNVKQQIDGIESMTADMFAMAVALDDGNSVLPIARRPARTS